MNQYTRLIIASNQPNLIQAVHDALLSFGEPFYSDRQWNKIFKNDKNILKIYRDGQMNFFSSTSVIDSSDLVVEIDNPFVFEYILNLALLCQVWED